MAESIVKEAEAPTRKIIQEERTKVADAMINGLAWLSASALAAIGTWYLVDPKSKAMKFAGYGSAAALSGAGAIITAASLREPSGPQKAPGTTSESVKSVSDQAAASMVAAAEPKIRAIVNEERERVAGSVQSGLPLAAGGALAAVITAMMVDDSKAWMKVSGYSASVLLAAAGAWIALDRVKK